MPEPSLTAPPVASIRPTDRTHHGHTFADPYAWLTDRSDPDVVSYLTAENAWTEQQTAHLGPLRQQIFDDISARTQQTDLSVPSYVRHDAADGTSTVDGCYGGRGGGEEYLFVFPARARAPGMPPDLTQVVRGESKPIDGEEVLLDCNVEAEGQEFFSLGALGLSTDGSLLAWSADLTGDERFTLRVRDLATGDLTGDEVPDTGYGVAWAGRTHLFYTRNNDAWRTYQVLRHRLGTPASEDVVVWQEDDDRFMLFVGSSRDDQWILLGAGSMITSEYRLLSADDPEGEPALVAARRDGVEYSVEVAGDRMLIVHNADNEDFDLAQAPLTASSHTDWEPVLPSQVGVRIVDVDAYADYAVVGLRRNGLTAVHVLPRTADGGFGSGTDLSFDEPLYSVSSPGWETYQTDRVRLSFTSLVTPESVFDYVLSSGELILRKRMPVQDHPVHGPYRSQDYVQTREWATATDGTRVPMSIVRRAGTPLDGTAPALLYGYGSYEMSIDPSFRIARLSLLDRGFVFAIAHIRGGGEMGRHWYTDGKLRAKRNTFTDFIACGEHLVRAGYTSADRLAAEGGSAGGLLMGAVANLAPATFRAIHAAVPFVDALTTTLNPDLPLTVGEWEEWGNPLADAETYAYMRSYTPYENVAAQAYPAILATTSLNDTRVMFTEPAKWVAALRATAIQPADRPILLKTEMVAGHGGVSGRYQKWKETAFELAWIIDQVAPTG